MEGKRGCEEKLNFFIFYIRLIYKELFCFVKINKKRSNNFRISLARSLH